MDNKAQSGVAGECGEVQFGFLMSRLGELVYRAPHNAPADAAWEFGAPEGLTGLFEPIEVKTVQNGDRWVILQPQKQKGLDSWFPAIDHWLEKQVKKGVSLFALVRFTTDSRDCYLMTIHEIAECLRKVVGKKGTLGVDQLSLTTEEECRFQLTKDRLEELRGSQFAKCEERWRGEGGEL
jgi:hypothetical protein